MKHSVIEYELDDGTPSSDDKKAAGAEFPAYVFVVDNTGSDNYLELIKSAILAAIETLPAQAWVGLVVFSHKVGLYNLNSPVPSVRYTRIPATNQCNPPLHQVLPLSKFLVRLEANKDNLSVAVESIQAFQSPSEDKAQEDRRGLGSCLSSLCSLLNPTEYSIQARMMLFLSGLPNWGLGRLQTRAFADSKHPDQEIALLGPQSDFYKDLAQEAAFAGICFDLYCVSDLQYMDLASLKFLSVLTGGQMLLYENTEDSSLPQDLFKQLKKTQAFGCMFRMRTSNAFRAAAVYGHLIPDKHYDNLYHLASCDARKTVSVEFVHEQGTGFSSYLDRVPILQVAFSYTGISPEGEPCKRLRVITWKKQAASNLGRLFDSTNTEATIALLTQQLVHATLDTGTERARLELQEWLIQMRANYAKSRYSSRRVEDITASDLTTLFSDCESLQFLPRFAFVMLKHPLFASRQVHPDTRIYLQCLTSALEPTYLGKLYYPTLSSFPDLDTPSEHVCYLSSSSMAESKHRVFVMDAFTAVYVRYAEEAKDMPLPPPHNSEVRKLVKLIRKDAPLVSPQVVFARAGEDDDRYFSSRLLEDEESMGISYTQFMAAIDKEVLEVLKAQS